MLYEISTKTLLPTGWYLLKFFALQEHNVAQHAHITLAETKLGNNACIIFISKRQSHIKFNLFLCYLLRNMCNHLFPFWSLSTRHWMNCHFKVLIALNIFVIILLSHMLRCNDGWLLSFRKIYCIIWMHLIFMLTTKCLSWRV